MITGDLYAYLGVRRDASADDIQAAYERRVNAAAESGALSVITQIDAAYEVLRNPHRRRVYDETGEVVDVPRISWVAAPHLPGRNWTTTPDATSPIRRRSRTWGRSVLGRSAMSLVIAVIAVAIWQSQIHTRRGAIAGAATGSPGQPSLHLDHAPTRVHPLVAAPPGTGGFTLVMPKYPGARWNPCRAIHYVVFGDEPWHDANRMLDATFAEMSRLTGLAFVADGMTTEGFNHRRAAYQPTKYGDRWAPVLVTWTTPAVDEQLANRVAGDAGPDMQYVSGHPEFVSGTVSLDAPQLALSMNAGARGAAQVRVTMLHELGHLVGLGHYTAGPSLMQPMSSWSTRLSDGDRRGLAEMGAGTCWPIG